MAALITFLSDFGLEDAYVGLCHAVLLQRAPQSRVVDLTHAIAPQDVRRAALLLADVVPYVPHAVHLAVVDPGVGSKRRGVAVIAGEAVLIGPDNGLLWPAAGRLGGPTAVFELRNPELRLPAVSATFHGRDVFAPAAAHVAAGGDPSDLGPSADPATLVRLEVPDPVWRVDRWDVEVRDVDRFGNIQLAFAAGDASGAQVELHARDDVHDLPFGRTFADFPPGELGLLVDSFGWLAVVRNGGSAAALLGLRPGDRVSMRGIGAPR